MKLKQIFMAMLLTVSTTVLADNFSYLTISQSGEETSFSISEISKITFDANNMIINMTNGENAQIPLASLSKMFFSETGLTGITAASTNKPQISLSGGIIHVNAPTGSIVTLFNMKGQAVKSITATHEDTQINVNGLTKGVYIVKVGDQAKKIMNK